MAQAVVGVRNRERGYLALARVFRVVEFVRGPEPRLLVVVVGGIVVAVSGQGHGQIEGRGRRFAVRVSGRDGERVNAAHGQPALGVGDLAGGRVDLQPGGTRQGIGQTIAIGIGKGGKVVVAGFQTECQPIAFIYVIGPLTGLSGYPPVADRIGNGRVVLVVDEDRDGLVPDVPQESRTVSVHRAVQVNDPDGHVKGSVLLPFLIQGHARLQRQPRRAGGVVPDFEAAILRSVGTYARAGPSQYLDDVHAVRMLGAVLVFHSDLAEHHARDVVLVHLAFQGGVAGVVDQANGGDIVVAVIADYVEADASRLSAAVARRDGELV